MTTDTETRLREIEKTLPEFEAAKTTVGRSYIAGQIIRQIPYLLALARSQAAEIERLTRRAMLDILREYRCQHHQYHDNGGGMSLVDLLTPSGDESITRGLEELVLLADFLESALLDKADSAPDSAPGLQNPSIPPQTGANASKTAHSPLTGQEQGGQVSERLKAGHAPTSQPNAQQSNGLQETTCADSAPPACGFDSADQPGSNNEQV